MDIAQAKQQVKDTVEVYLARDEHGDPLLAPSQQRPIFLVGAPGIGKTAIMEQIADELGIGLVSYSMTHHTRQSALGLPLIVQRAYGGRVYDASEYTMSEIIATVYDCMRESGRESGILFLDEINCVSETLYPSMLQFLQFKTFGRHAVPEGWVVVTAGNPPEYNRSVHEFDVVTLDRMKKVAVEPDYAAWRAYAADKGVHPAVLTFLDVKKNRFYVMESSLDGKAFVTARGWDDLSDIIIAYERLGKPVDRDLVAHYVQNERVAGEFAAYYELFSKYRDDYRVEDILAGRAPVEVVERAREAAFDERLSLVGLLLDALDGEHRALMARADVLVAARDGLRAARSAVDAGASPRAAVGDLLAQREREAAELAAAGGASRERRRRLAEERALLEEVAHAAALADGEDAAAFGRVAEAFAAQADLDGAAAAADARLAAAFAFLEAAFGDAQELLVFVTELTQRTPSARFIAQFGSPSYYAHNQQMILSDRQRRLRELVEELDV